VLDEPRNCLDNRAARIDSTVSIVVVRLGPAKVSHNTIPAIPGDVAAACDLGGGTPARAVLAAAALGNNAFER
jgi:hypothetical protein